MSRRRLVLGTLVLVGVLGLLWLLNTVFHWLVISDDTLGNIANVCGVIGLVVAVIAAIWPVIDTSDTSTSNSPTDLADNLAQNLLDEWLDEADARQLRLPGVMPLVWSAADNLPTDDKTIPVRRGRLDGDFDAAAAQLARTYDTIPDGRLLVLGEPGAGKTVLAILLAIGLLQRRNPGGPVPMLLSLSSWDPSGVALNDWIVSRIADTHYGGSTDIPRALLRNDLLLPILDGLDEIPEPSRPIAVSGINRSTGASRPVVLTCRRAEFEDVVKGGGPVLRHAASVQILPLTADDAVSYLSRTEWPDGTTWEPVFTVLVNEPDSSLATAFRSPLMVSAAKSAYEHGGDPAELLTIDGRHDLENHLLDRLVETAYPRAGATAGDSDGDGDGATPKQREHQWLTFIASYLYRHRERDIAWWRLTSGMLSEKSAIALVSFIFAIITVTCFLLLSLFAAPLSRVDRAVASIAPGFFLSFPLALSFQAGKARLPGRLSFASRGSWRRARQAFVRGAQLPALLGAAVLVGYPIIVGFGEWEWSFESVQGYFATAAFITGSGLIVGLGLAVHDWLTTPREDARRADPVDLLRNDRTSAIVGATIAGAAVALLLIPVFVLCVTVAGSLGQLTTGWPGSSTRLELPFTLPMYDDNNMSAPVTRLPGWAVGVSLVAGLVFALCVLASRAWTRFLVLRVSLRVSRDLPLRLMGFLADAQHRQLLRRAGGVYQFRHIRLQERLVTRAAPVRDELDDLPEDLGRRLRRLARRHAAALAVAATAIFAVLASALAIPRDQAVLALECGNHDPLYRLFSTPNGITFVGVTARDLCFWHRDSREPFATAPLPGGIPDSAVLANDGRRLLTNDGGKVTVWETGTGKQIKSMPVGDSETGLTLSPDGMTVASERIRHGGSAASATLWNVTSGMPQRSLPHMRIATAFRYSPDGHNIAWYSSYDPQISIVGTRSGPGAPPLVLGKSADGATGRSAIVDRGFDTVQFSPDGSLIAAAGGRRITVWTTSDGADAVSPSEVRENVSWLTLGNNGQYLVAGTATGDHRLEDRYPGAGLDVAEPGLPGESQPGRPNCRAGPHT